jgi:2-polyprenyl-6-methoxyphenol hydroxylase-like FAD-dependent oxidoreductase
MTTVVVAGASIAGLAAALAFSRSGHDILLLERSAVPPEGPVAEAAGYWHRPTVPQARHSHTVTSLGVRVLREHAPQVLDSLLSVGATLCDLTKAMPPGTAGREPGDDDLVALGCRRTTFELALYRYVRALPRVRIRHVTAVRGLLLDQTRSTVRGVVTQDGDAIPGDLVVDATGRRARAADWLAAAGRPVVNDVVSPSGLVGFSRFYRLHGHELPGVLNRGNAAGGILDRYAAVLHPGDARTFAIAIGVLPSDRELAGRLRHPAAFTALARATPGLDRWLTAGVSEPISAVRVINSPPNALRGAAVHGGVAGLLPVGDAACVTNPLFGRGISLALAHAFELAELLAARPVVDHAQATAAVELAERFFRPWYEHAANADAERIGRWHAAARSIRTQQVSAAAASGDGPAWRQLTRMLMCLATPAELSADTRFVPRGVPAADDHPPTRSALSRAVATAAGG